MGEILGKATVALFYSGFVSVLFTGWIGYVVFLIIGNFIEADPEKFGPIGFAIAWFITFAFIYENSISEDKKGEISQLQNRIAGVENEKEQVLQSANRTIEVANTERDVYKASLIEKSTGFPTLLNVINEFEQVKDENLAEYLYTKKHPSPKSAEVVKEEARRRREAEFEMKNTKLLIEYYESLAPFLLDYKNEIALPEEEEVLADYTEEERADPSTHFLTKEEFRRLSPLEKNQRALERYWKRPKSKWLIGRIYERYVGYLYEKEGYDVDYVGIFKGYEDLGRDLVCTKGNEIVVIQCKNWSQFKTIFEKHIFQFFGTVFQYKDENKGKTVKAVFYTTTTLSDLARRFAKELKIDLMEGFKMHNGYPCIKCNISADGTKIYHLPFDQQYDNVKIETHKGEFYCATVKEAEDAGFRRAFRHKFGKA